MSKRAAEASTEPEERESSAKRARTQERWYVRLGELLPVSASSRYGKRLSVAVDDMVMAIERLRNFSLVIPVFTRQKDIPSGETEQMKCPWLWGTYEHLRYFGLLDMDMNLTAVVEGTAPLFTDRPATVYGDKQATKLAFAERLVEPGQTFGQVAAVCPPFAALYEAVCALRRALDLNQIGHVMYFSGGGGFRLLFVSTYAWRRVTWGQGYAATFHAQELRGLLRRSAPSLEERFLNFIVAATDKSVYDTDKGTKPDLLAHFDTRVFPLALTAGFDRRQPSRTQRDTALEAAICGFWRYIFATVPDPGTTAPLGGQLREPGQSNKKKKQKNPFVTFYSSPVLFYEKCNKSEATHFSLVGEMTSYRKVVDTQKLFKQMVAWGQGPLFINEKRTPVTRHLIDYDGGPPLLEPLRCADGHMETPLRVLQKIHHECVLAGPGSYWGVLLTCPPRPEKPGARAHLIWPDWLVRLEHASGIVAVVHDELSKRWPGIPWSKFVESPPKIRMLFCDKLNRDTGEPENRPIRFETAFDTEGTPVALIDVSPTAAAAAGDGVALLNLTTTRLPDTDPAGTATLTPVVLSAAAASSSSGNTTLEVLTPENTRAVEATVKAALQDVAARHGMKRELQPYGKDKWKIYPRSRIMTLGVLGHHQCAPDKTHSSNNVSLLLYMDRNVWELSCFSPDCPQKSHPAPMWGYGVVDTSALRAAWPRAVREAPHEEPIPDSGPEEEEEPVATTPGGKEEEQLLVLPTLDKDPGQRVRQACQEVLEKADKWTRRSGSTACTIHYNTLAKSANGVCTVVELAAALRYLYPKRVLRVTLMRSARGNLVICQDRSDHMERELRDRFLPPKYHCLATAPAEAIPEYGPKSEVRERDLERLVDELGAQEISLRSQMTVVVADAGYDTERKQRFQRLLKEVHQWPVATQPSYVCLSSLVDTTPPQRRRILFVDRAHLLGTTALRKVAGLVQCKAVYFVGCPLLLPLTAGVGLGDIFPVPTLGHLRTHRWIQVAMAAYRAGLWEARLTEMSNEEYSLEGVLESVKNPIFCTDLVHTSLVAIQWRHIFSKIKQKVQKHELPALFRYCRDESRTLVMCENTLQTFTRAEWMQFLVYVKCQVFVLCRPRAQDSVSSVLTMMQAAEHRPRLLAGSFVSS